MTEIETKYYDGSYCPKCKSVDYDVDFESLINSLCVYPCQSCDHLDLVVSGICNECGCKFHTNLVHGSGPVESNVYHFETEIEEES